MYNEKYQKLISYVLNEEHEKANELFHQIVVESSREIYESIMSEDEGMGGQVGDLLDEISAEESGVMEDDDDLEMDDDFGDEEMDFEFGGMEDDDLESLDDSDDHEETLLRIEDKLDQLVAEFEEIMAADDDMDMDDDMAGDMDMDMDDDFGDEEDMDMDMDMDDDMDDESEEVMEGTELQKVSVTHGDNGTNTRSPNVNNSGQKGMDSKPVKFSGQHESVPTGPKSPSNIYSKGMKEVPGAGSFKNAPGHKKSDLDNAPKPKHGDDGTNTKSPVAESRRRARPVTGRRK
jgi:hypothetical protein